MEEDIFSRFETGTEEEKKIIKVVGVGGGGCNAVSNMYREGMNGVSFCVCDTNSSSLLESPVPVKMVLGKSGLGAGSNPAKGREEAESNIEDLKELFSDGTQMVFVTAGMGSGTGTGAAPLVAGVAKEMGLLTIGIVTLPFYFEKRRKIQKALIGLEEMRKNVDALLIINNQQLCKVYSGARIPVSEAFEKADQVLSDATRSISELITIIGKIDVDFRDVEATMRNGGGAIMAMGRASGEYRVEKSFENALNSPLLYGSDISKAKRILFNVYTSSESPLFINEMDEIDAFMDELDPNIDVIWGIATDDTLDKDAKVTILATGFDNKLWDEDKMEELDVTDEEYLDKIIFQLYGKCRNNKIMRIHHPDEEEKQNDDVKTYVNTQDGLVEIGNNEAEAEEENTDETAISEEKAVEEVCESTSQDDDESSNESTEENTDVNEQVQQPVKPKVPTSKGFIQRMHLRFSRYLTEMVSEDEEV